MRRTAIVVTMLAALVAACGGSSTGPSSNTVTDTLEGSLTTAGSKTHTLQVNTGQWAATVTSLPSNIAYVGIAFGTWNGTTCTVAAVNENAAVGGGLQGSVTAGTTICVKVYDVGLVPVASTVNYVVKVLHY